MRERSAVILIKNNKVGLIKRVRNGKTYYVFPGGGIKAGETPENAAKREALEETGLEVEIQECIETVDFNGKQYYFLAAITGGEFGSGNGEEFTEKNQNRGTYLPVWIEVCDLATLTILPAKVAMKVQGLLRS